MSGRINRNRKPFLIDNGDGTYSPNPEWLPGEDSESDTSKGEATPYEEFESTVNEREKMKENDIWYTKSGKTITSYYKNVGTGIKLYDIAMEPIKGKSPYDPLRTFVINLIRTNSALGARINQDALDGYRGSAAMIDYVLRFKEHLNGKLDRKIMFGSPDAVRSRVAIIENELFSILKKELADKGSFHLLEVGPGYLRTQINLINRLREERINIDGLKIVGIDFNPDVVKAASEIIRYERLENVVSIFEGNAQEWLASKTTLYDAVLAEGVFEYLDMIKSIEFANELANHIRKGGYLLATATHKVPKKKVIEYLDILVLQRSVNEFVKIFESCGFTVPRLVPTDPPNVSVGIGRKK